MDTRALPTPTGRSRVVGEVVVTSRHRLVAQAVTAGLRRRQLEARSADWGDGEWRRLAKEDQVVLLLDELDSRSAVDVVVDAVSSVSASGARVLVLTGRSAGPVWGAVLAAGAAAVATSDSSLDELEEELAMVAAGEPIVAPERRTALEQEWADWLDEEERLRARVERLSPRETSVLALLAEGHRVVDIGRDLGVSEGTVRSQVKSLRRKLGVDSQLAAVAIANRLAGRLPDPPPAPPAPRSSGD